MSHRSFISSFLSPTGVGLCACTLLAVLVSSSFAGAAFAAKDKAEAHQLAAALTPPFDLTDPARIAAGKELFSSSCATYCHGENPPLFIGRTDLTAPFVYTVISSGGIGKAKPMPSWGNILTKEEIWELVAYIKSLGRW